MSMADLKPREPGHILYKEGWHKWDGRGKQEEEAFAGHTLGCIRLMVTDNNIEPFYWQDWEPIEHFAAQGVIKDSIWTARMTRLGLKARIDIPVAGTMINVVNDRLQERILPMDGQSLQKAGGRNTTTRWIKHLKKSMRTWPIPASTRQFLRAQQQHRHLNGTLPWKPTGLHIMVVSERTGMRVPTPKEWEGRDDKLHGQNGMTCTGPCRTVSLLD